MPWSKQRWLLSTTAIPRQFSFSTMLLGHIQAICVLKKLFVKSTARRAILHPLAGLLGMTAIRRRLARQAADRRGGLDADELSRTMCWEISRN